MTWSTRRPKAALPVRACFTAAEDLGAMDIPRGQVLERATTCVFVFNTGDLKGTGRQRWMTAATDLDAGLLIRAQYVLVRPEWLALPGTGVQIEHRSSQFPKVRIARKDPALVSPGA